MNNIKKNIYHYLDYCENQKRLSPKTVRAYKTDLLQFINFMHSPNLSRIKSTDIENYIKSLHNNYKPKSVKRKIASVKAFFTYLEYNEIILTNPMSRVQYKFREPITLPRTISLDNIQSILKCIYNQIQNGKTSYRRKNAIRDAAVCELLFATGIRIFELCSLKPYDIDLIEDILLINGKGAKERILQIGNEQVHNALVKYKNTYEKEISNCNHFFTNQKGTPFSDQCVRRMIIYYTELAGIDQHITPHMWRHTFATLLLEEDVDIRYIQEMLGHSSIRTTEIYTHVSQSKQKYILCNKHPRNKFTI